MTKPILILGGTGKTGRRISARLREQGAPVRTAARHGADVHFDWDDPRTYEPVLDGVKALYLVPPPEAMDYVGQVSQLLDRAEAAGVQHVTHLSARGVEGLPDEVSPRAVELNLASRSGLTRSTLRPGWFMQNFSEWFFRPTGGSIAAPTGTGAEAFIHADDIADAAVATLTDPLSHDGAAYTLTGPNALSFAEVAHHISNVTGVPVRHDDVDRDTWIAARTGEGLPQDYAELLAALLGERLRANTGAAATDDVQRATGHPPRSFEDFAAEPETAAAWKAAIAG